MSTAPTQVDASPWYSLPATAVVEEMHTEATDGLTAAQVDVAASVCGPNTLSTARVRAARRRDRGPACFRPATTSTERNRS